MSKLISAEDVDFLTIEKKLKESNKAPNHYIKNRELQAEFLKHHYAKEEAKEKGLPEPQLPETICKSIITLVERYASKHNFASYTYRDEMVGDAIEIICRYIHNYDPVKYDNPFAYLTQIAKQAFRRRIRLEKRETYVKYKEFDKTGGFSANEEASGSDPEIKTMVNETTDQYKDYLEFIDTFEEKNGLKKERKKPVRRSKETANTLDKFK